MPKKPFLVNWFSRVSDLIIPNGNPPIVTISSFFKKCFGHSSTILETSKLLRFGQELPLFHGSLMFTCLFLFPKTKKNSRPSGRSQVAGSFQPNSSTNSAICQGWESQRHFSQHIPSTTALLDWLYSRKTGSLAKAGADQDIYKLS